MRWSVLLLVLLSGPLSVAQVDTVNVPNSTNGWYLSPHGTIRILLLFVEIEYDKSPSRDPQLDGAAHWPKGQLPKWKDDVFDPQPAAAYLGQISRYYHDMSMGRYTVLGDYIDTILTLRESEYPGVGNAHTVGTLAVQEANKMGALRTHHQLSAADFDLWKRGGRPGMPKHRGPDAPNSYDHVMVIVRNNGLGHNQGSVDPGSPGKLFGFESDSQSRFGGMYGMPYEILQHEYNHLLFGGNNFHAGGGNAGQFTRYFLCMQGGWSMMGGSNSALLTGNAWDRNRLGWRREETLHGVAARNAAGDEVNGRIDPMNGDTGIYVLRDFMTTGDALRITLPFLVENEYPQGFWLENHQTTSHNGVLSDRFHYELVNPCVKGAVPGIYAFLQVDRENDHGTDIYGQHSDYIRAIPASGFHDYELRGDTLPFECLWPSPTVPMIQRKNLGNALTGGSELEIPLFDTGKEELRGLVPRIVVDNGTYMDEAFFLGHTRQVFVPGKAGKLGLGTNPSLANMLTFTSTQGKALRGATDNRVVHLSDIAVEFLQQRSDGAIVVRVSRNNVRVDQDARWSADSVVLHIPEDRTLPALVVGRGSTVRIDRSRTPTRSDKPERVGSFRYYNAPTSFTVVDGGRVRLEEKASLVIEHGSTLHLMPGCKLELHRKAQVSVDGDSHIALHSDASIVGTRRQLKRLGRSGRTVRLP